MKSTLFPKASADMNAMHFEVRKPENFDALVSQASGKQKVSLLVEGYITSMSAHRDEHFPGHHHYMSLIPTNVVAVSDYVEELDKLTEENEELKQDREAHLKMIRGARDILGGAKSDDIRSVAKAVASKSEDLRRQLDEAIAELNKTRIALSKLSSPSTPHFFKEGDRVFYGATKAKGVIVRVLSSGYAYAIYDTENKQEVVFGSFWVQPRS